ncbi:MAG: PAS domain S-box protein, partial [Candidatus Firestonebacteria bacterium]|nr:PAS domain S-box protein [Candidatus Firestonebacteria bacterium]
MPNPSRDPKPLSTEAEKINQCGQELGVLRAQAAATAQRIERFSGLLNVLGEVQPSRLHQSNQTQLAQDLCTRLVEQKYYTHVRIVLLNADGYPASGAQAGFSEDLEKIIHPREDGGWARCLQSARERSTVLAIMDPAFSCGPCPLAVACQRQGVLVTNISCGQRVFGILAVAVPRTSLAHVEEKSALRLLSNALGDEFFNLEVGSDLEKCRRWIRESERMQTALNALPTPLVIYDGNGQPFWSNQAQGTRQPSSHQHATGTEDRCWLIEKQSYLEPDGSQGGTIEIAWNATETARSETALRACLETAQHMLAAGHDFLWTADIYGRFTSVSPQVETLLGFAPAELQGRPLAEFMEPEKDTPYENNFEMALTSATPLSRVMRTLHHRDGREITFEISAQPLYGLEGTCRGFQGCCRDVTEQTRAEKALLESESRFRNIFSSSPSALVLADPQGRVVEINRSMCELFGIMDKTMVSQMNLADYLPLTEEDHAALRAHRIVRREGTFNPDTFQGNRAFKPAQAGPLHLEVLISFFPWQRDSAVEGYLVQMQDITDRKNAEDALCQSEEKYRMIVENSGSALLIINEDLTLSLINREMENLCGFTLMELQAMDHWYKNIFPEDLEKIKQNHFQRRVNPDSVPSSYEVRFRHKNGEIRTVLFRVTLIPSTRQSMAAILDITERKHTEEALRLSEEKYRATFENSGTALALLEDDLIISLVNQKMTSLLGWARAALEGKATWPGFLADPADHEKFAHCRQMLLQDPAVILKSCECGIRHQDGGTRDVMAAMTYLPASRQFLISLVDITESKAAEKKLKESEQRYRLLADNIHDVIWMTNAEGRLTFITPSITRLRGFAVEEVLAQTPEQIFTPN